VTFKPPASFSWADNAPVRLDHSSVKHDLLRSYIRDYLNILTNVPKRTDLRLTLFDGFAGGGTFEDRGSVVAGTPMIMAEEVVRASAEKAAERSIAFNVDLWAAEKSRQNYEALEQSFAASNMAALFPGRIHLRNCHYEVALREAIERMLAVRGTSGRSIFLFDQTGFGQVDLEHIRYIFHALKAPEVILTFSVSWLVDLARNDPEFLKKVSRIGINEGALAEMLEAKEAWSPRYGGQKWIRRYIAEYIGAEFNTCFFLKCRPSNKDIWLLHFAKQWRARDAMMEVHYRYSNKTHFYGKSGLEMLGFDPRVDASQMKLFEFTAEDALRSSNSLLEDIPRSLHDKGGVGGIELRQLFTRELNDATLTFRMFEQGAVLARDNNLIDIFTKDGRPRRQARWLNRDDVVKLPAQSTIWHFLGGA
jgi:three-Cys-motif partner protein